MKSTNTTGIVSAVFTTIVLSVFSAHAQSVTVTPMKGQSADQMNIDKTDCTSIAQQSAASAPPPAAAPQRGGAVRGAARGAAVGGIAADRNGGSAYDRAPDGAKQEYRQDQARKGAAVGAVVGAGQQRRGNAQAAQQQQASQNQATDAAFRSCLISRGYDVK